MNVSGYLLPIPLLLMMIVLFGVPATGQIPEPQQAGPNRTVRSGATDAFARADRLSFVENRGQVVDTRGASRPDILYTSGGGEGRVFFRRNGVSYLFTRIRGGWNGGMRVAGLIDPAAALAGMEADGYRMDMELVGADTTALVTAEEPASDYTNYYLPHAPDGIVHVPAYRRLIYHEIYPGIDLQFYSDGRGLKYDFIVRPGGDPSRIRLRYHGALGVCVTGRGMLRATTPLGAIEEGVPVSYQGPSGVRCRWTVSGDEAGFSVGSYDRSRPLVIDPTVIWATYFGGSSAEAFYGYYAAITVDGDDNVAIAGLTMSFDLPVSVGAAFEYSAGDYDAFVAKFDAGGRQLWGTYYGGGDLDIARGIDAGSSTDLAICGYTRSIDFPVDVSAAQGVNNGGEDAFIIMLDRNGVRRWGTYYGGADNDMAQGIAIDRSGNVAVAGYTGSGDFPVTPDAFQKKFVGRDVDHAFVARFTNGGARLWSTFYGGSGTDRGNAVAVAADGGIAIAGVTNSTDLPVTPSAYQPKRAGDNDAFVAIFAPDGAERWGTYLGGDSIDAASGIAIDAEGSVLVCGTTESGTFPTTISAEQPRYAGPGSDAFVVKLSSGGVLQWGTYYGGSAYEIAGGICTSALGDIYLVGLTFSADFPVTPGTYQQVKDLNTDAFLVELDETGKRIWATFYGGDNVDAGSSVDADDAGNIYIAGVTERSLLPGTMRGFQKNPNKENDAFIAKFGNGCGAVNPSLAPGGTINFCPGDTVTLSAPPGYAYLWEPGGATTRNLIVTTSGDFRVLLTTPGGCLDTSRWVKIRQQFMPSPAIETPSGIMICDGDSVELRAVVTGDLSYRWSTGDTVKNIFVREGGVYTITVTNRAGCRASASITVMHGSAPVARIAGPLSVCVNSTFHYQTPAGEKLLYAWRVIGNGSIAGRADSNVVTIDWGDAGEGTITLTTIDAESGCFAIRSLQVTVGEALKPMVIPNRSTVLCEGDSLLLDAGDGYAEYLWSTGELTRMITVHAAGIYSVTVADADGCSGASDPVVVLISSPAPVITGDTVVCAGESAEYMVAGPPDDLYAWSVNGGRIVSGQGSPAVTVLWGAGPMGVVEVSETSIGSGCTGRSGDVAVAVHPLPAPSIHYEGSTLLREGAGIVLDAGDGFLSYRWSDGETAQTITVRDSGDYSVLVTNAYGCGGRSDTLHIALDTPLPRESVIALPLLDAAPGDTITVPIRLRSLDLATPGAIGYHGVLRVDATLLHPLGSASTAMLDGGDWKISFGGVLHDTDSVGTLAEMRFIALLGDSDRATLALDSFAWSDSTITMTIVVGEVRLRLCGSDGERMVVAGGRFALKSIHPDPVRAGAEIEYELIENGRARLAVTDMLGREVALLADGDALPGTHVARFDAGELPSGLYIVTLRSATGRESLLMQVIR